MKLSRLAYLLILLILPFSCVESINFEVENTDPMLIVDGEITTEAKAHRVKLTLSTDVFDDQPARAVVGALVTIEDEIYRHTLTEVEPGIYETIDTVRGYEGREYTLTIVAEGETYTATETLRPVTSIDCAFLTQGDPNSFFLSDDYMVLMSAQEPQGLGDYYLWNYYQNGVLKTDTVTEKWYSDDELFDGVDFEGAIVMIIDSEGVNIQMDTLTLEMKSISEGYYDYLFGLQLETFRGSPFDGPPANPPSNILKDGEEEKAFGFFRACDVSRKDMCVVFVDDQGNPDLGTFFRTCDAGCQQTAFELLGQ